MLIKKSIILTPCNSTQRKLENDQRKSYRILVSSCCWPTDIRFFDFYRKRGLGPDQSHYNQSQLWSRLHTTLAQITRITPKWIYTLLNIFSPFRIFEQLTLPLKFFTVLNILFTVRIFEQHAFALKNSCPENSHSIETFFTIQDFWATCACPEIFRSVGAVAPRPPTSYAYVYSDKVQFTHVCSFAGKVCRETCKGIVLLFVLIMQQYDRRWTR